MIRSEKTGRHQLVVALLRVVLGLSLLGSLVVQTVMVPLAWNDTREADLPNRVLMLVLVVWAS